MTTLEEETEKANKLFERLLAHVDEEPFKSMDTKVRAGIYARAFAFQAMYAGLDVEEQVEIVDEAREDLKEALLKLLEKKT